MSKKADRKRIERLEEFVHSLIVEDTRRRHVESFARMTDEEVASLYFATKQLREVGKEDPWKADELFRSGLAATEYLDERGKLGWRRYCETGGQAAMVEFADAHEDEGRPRRPGLKGDPRVLFDDINPGGRRTKGINFHEARLARESEKKHLSQNDTPS